ncbi:septum site-determining protein MinC [Listeria booriae]|uniref:Probable septum site-determining protein MinC n=1 Tax=Listeria booriae TaxID=1552123 RepID=A0A7X0XCM8_9LIST|nr:septum site-determining protein MinC [Listeria booriae]MBC1211600.1 septum site-determining protein MinC [Listeria booriae]MBC1226656.1 septum site-determining protein MinC [Listeria booriae]MBC1230092.1 septum site-determining protein MinC [Listeria booriae]MBC1234585.1 septum site-determining protein MinC [Listeria booriae]MBC1245137.1 septum site-determining protein MinC [Listeria booriae]
MKRYIQIKGTKDGISISLSDVASIAELENGLIQHLKEQQTGMQDQKLAVQVHIGNRLFTEEEEQRIKAIIQENSQMEVKGFTSNVMTKQAAKKWKEAEQIFSLATVVRSGQVINVPGDLLLVGDINPGGAIRSTGNVYILGNVKGIIHAGIDGDKKAVVTGKFQYPSQIRIAGEIRSFDDEESKNKVEENILTAYLDDKNELMIDSLQILRKIRPEISNFQGGQ